MAKLKDQPAPPASKSSGQDPKGRKAAADPNPCDEAPCKEALAQLETTKAAFQKAKETVEETQTKAADLSRQGQREQHRLAVTQRELNHARMVCKGARARVLKAQAVVEETCPEDCVPKPPTKKELRCP